jgi:formate hydrogenlyase subunit 3/multisubunit Na+/H+ antiporter MnhD subunit
MIHAMLLSLGPGLPLLLALACCLPVLRPAAKWFLPWAAVPALLTPFIVPTNVVVHVPWFFMGGRMGLDATGEVMLGVTGLIWFLAGLAYRGRPGLESRRLRFTGYFLVAMAGNCGLILAREMLGYYLFFAMMSFAAYGLVAHNRTNASRRAGRIYLFLVIIGEVAMFAALTMLANVAQSIVIADNVRASLPPAVIVLLFIGFGVKVGVLPFHVRMPLAYQTTPTPAATALAGAMVNAGLLGWLRFLPLSQTAEPEGALLFIACGALAALYGVIIGMGQKRARAVLAYSSISQMGLMTVIVGLGLIDPKGGQQGIPLLILYAVHHSLAKSSLFLGCEAVARKRRTTCWQLAGLLLPGLALAGLPLTGGAVIKTGLKVLAATVGEPWLGWGRIFLPVTSDGTTILMLHFIRLRRRTKSADTTPIGPVILSAWLISLAAVATAFWLWPTARISALHSLAVGILWQSLWPVAIGCLLAYGWNRLAGKRDTLYTLPAGDILALLPQAVGRGWQRSLHTWTIRIRVSNRLRQRRWRQSFRSSGIDRRLRKGEKVLERWGVVGLVYLLLCTLFLFFLL